MAGNLAVVEELALVDVAVSIVQGDLVISRGEHQGCARVLNRSRRRVETRRLLQIRSGHVMVCPQDGFGPVRIGEHPFGIKCDLVHDVSPDHGTIDYQGIFEFNIETVGNQHRTGDGSQRHEDHNTQHDGGLAIRSGFTGSGVIQLPTAYTTVPVAILDLGTATGTIHISCNGSHIVNLVHRFNGWTRS